MSNIQAITYEGGAAVTVSDTFADPAGPFAGFFVGVAGAVVIQTIRGDKLTLAACNAGVVYTIAITRVWSTGTNASSIVGLIALPYKTSLNPGTGVVV